MNSRIDTNHEAEYEAEYGLSLAIYETKQAQSNVNVHVAKAIQEKPAAGVSPERIRKLSAMYPTMKFSQATKRQVDAARKFAAEHDTTVSQAVKYLNVYFAYQAGKITLDELNALV
jgi:hypothetical protein